MNSKLFIDIAEWLGKTRDVVKLRRLEQFVNSGKYYITLWGHYSAGKSCLINSILGSDILPVKLRETTAVLTYIQYGLQEECHIIYDNGRCSICSIEEVKNIFQNSELIDNLENIDHMEVYVNNNVLKNGLVLVDTPGVNTIIQKHQDLAVEAIEQSGKIIYVLGNSPSNVDREFINQIYKCGVDITFVRTKCDLINTVEEDVNEALRVEKEELKEFAGKEIKFIPVSNEKGNEWTNNILILKEELLNIALSISKEIDNAVNGRLAVYAKAYSDEVSMECERLNDVIDGNLEKVKIEVDACKLELQKLEQLAVESEKKIGEKVLKTQNESKRELDNLVDNSISKFAEELKLFQYSSTIAEDIKNYYDQELVIAIENMQGIMNGYLDSVVAEEHKIIEGTVENIVSVIPPTYVEVQRENSRLLEMYNSKLFEAKTELERIIAEKKNVSMNALEMQEAFDESVYEEALEALDYEMSQIPSGMALRLSEHQEVQPSSVFKKIGQTADLALLLLPGDVIVKAVKSVADTTKVAQILHKMGKAGEVIVKAGKTVADNTKVIDRVRDTAYTLNEVLRKRNYSTQKDKENAKILVDKLANKMGDAYNGFVSQRKSSSVLDALSVAYWTEKLGSQFDSPPKMEVDTEEQERRNQLRREISIKQKRLSEERIKKKKELGLIASKEKELELRKQEQQIMLEAIEKEVTRQEENVLKEARIEALNSYRIKYEKFFAKNLTKAAQMIHKGYYASAEQNITLYISSQNAELTRMIIEKKEKIQSLVDIQENGNDELVERLNEGKEYLAVIKEMVD